MSKTSLLHILRQAYHLATLANRSQIAPAETFQWDRHRLISRRQLLTATLMATGTLTAVALHHETTIAKESIEPILIVGAGIAGLTAGYYLQQAGIPIRIVEASNRIGGRIRSQQQAVGTSKTIELGGEFIDSGHQTIQKLAQELGLEVVDLVASDTGLKSEIRWFDRHAVEAIKLVTAFMPLAKQMAQDAKAAGEVTYKTANAKAQKLDRLSISGYLQKYCPDPLLRRFIEVAYNNEYGLPVEVQSALNLLLLIGKDPSKIEIYGSSDQRYYIKGGNQQITDRLAAKLANSIELNTSLESIRSTPNGRYRVSLRERGRSQEQVYERVILALPFSILRQINLDVQLPKVKQVAIQELGYGTNTKLITGYRDRLWRTKYGSNGQVFSDLNLLSETWESARYASDKQGAIVNFTGGELGRKLAKTQSNVAGHEFVTDLQKIFPGVKDSYLDKSIITNWIDSPYSLGSYACYLVGQWTKFAGAEGERVQNLFFAGEHCSLEAQGYMEGGCGTGAAVAKAILEDVKVKLR
jgi:monoamine oxidase